MSSSEALSAIARTVRTLSIDAVQKANSGHPGLPLGAADFSTVLWSRFLRFNPKDPKWAGRDRFILSAGHGCMLNYALLNLFGFDLPMSQLQSFRQWDSITPGHPEFGMTPGIEATTGPLGQGSANAVGAALSAKLLGAKYSKELFESRVFALVSDGDLMEGISGEAASLAGHLGLDNLYYLYDDNKISLAGPTSVCYTEDAAKRYEAYGWWVKSVDGHDYSAVAAAIAEAEKVTGKPKMILCRTTIGYGSPAKAGSHKSHGEPLGKDEVLATKKKLGAPEGEFFVPPEVQKTCAAIIEGKMEEYSTWQQKFDSWKKSNAALAAEYAQQIERAVPAELKSDLLAAFKEPKKDATRNMSGVALNVIAQKVSYLVGGSADLESSTKTLLSNSPEIQKGNFTGRNIRFGVREHAMGAVVNGFAYQQAWFPYSATFLTFSDYMRPTIRLAALSHLQSLFIFTHDSVYLGEDGPTHQSVEHTAALRLIPNHYVFRPADGVEVAMSYWAALERKKGPSTLLFTRQNLPVLEREAAATPDHVLKGGYVLSGGAHTDVVLVATGSEVSLAVDAAKVLAGKGVKARVVSMPCVELFLAQDEKYRDSVLPPSARKVSIEAGVTTGWQRIVGSTGLCIGIDHFGASAPAEVLAEKFGLTANKVAERVSAFIAR